MNNVDLHKKNVNNTVMLQGYLPEAGALVSMVSGNQSAVPTPVAIKDDDSEGSDFAKWGTNNDWPTKVRLKVESSTTAYPLMFKAVSLVFGKGLTYYREEYKDGKLERNMTRVPEIDSFFEENDIERFFLEQLMDYKFFGNMFSEFILDKNGKKVVYLSHKEAEFSRLAIMKNFKIAKLFYSGEWADDKKGKPITFLNPKFKSVPEILKESATSKRFAIHTYFPSPGRQYYAMPPHGAIYKDKGWLDFANAIPTILNAIVDNQISVKYHIKIPYEFWPSMHKGWDGFTQDKQKKIIQAELKKMDDWLKGKNNSGKAFISHFATDPITRKPIAGWEIEPLEDKLKKDEWLPSTQEADIQIARALGVDVSMAGIQPAGGKLGAGSGSDKRTGLINAVSLSHAEQKIIFEPLNLVKKINGWPSDVKFGFSHEVATTLDKNPTGTENNL